MLRVESGEWKNYHGATKMAFGLLALNGIRTAE